MVESNHDGLMMVPDDERKATGGRLVSSDLQRLSFDVSAHFIAYFVSILTAQPSPKRIATIAAYDTR